MSAWADSTRKARLPHGWQRIRHRILRRDPACCIAGPTCTGRSTEVDHRQRGDNHADSNLQGVCSGCHVEKTIAERTAVRPSPPHPGVIA